jgi:hypothetical protein
MALGLMRTMGALSAIGMAGTLFFLFRRDFRTHSIEPDESSGPDKSQPTT